MRFYTDSQGRIRTISDTRARHVGRSSEDTSQVIESKAVPTQFTEISEYQREIPVKDYERNEAGEAIGPMRNQVKTVADPTASLYVGDAPGAIGNVIELRDPTGSGLQSQLSYEELMQIRNNALTGPYRGGDEIPVRSDFTEGLIYGRRVPPSVQMLFDEKTRNKIQKQVERVREGKSAVESREERAARKESREQQRLTNRAATQKRKNMRHQIAGYVPDEPDYGRHGYMNESPITQEEIRQTPVNMNIAGVNMSFNEFTQFTAEHPTGFTKRDVYVFMHPEEFHKVRIADKDMYLTNAEYDTYMRQTNQNYGKYSTPAVSTEPKVVQPAWNPGRRFGPSKYAKGETPVPATAAPVVIEVLPPQQTQEDVQKVKDERMAEFMKRKLVERSDE